jgi:hypothetical protein
MRKIELLLTISVTIVKIATIPHLGSAAIDDIVEILSNSITE